jgi:hypothetical protein
MCYAVLELYLVKKKIAPEVGEDMRSCPYSGFANLPMGTGADGDTAGETSGR